MATENQTTIDGKYSGNDLKNTPYASDGSSGIGNYDYWWLQYNWYGYGQNRNSGSTPKKVDPDLTIYYIKESDLYKLYPYSKTNNKKEWEKERDAGNLYTRLDNVINIVKDTDDETDILEHYKELREYLSDGKNFKNDSGDENDPTLKAEWKEEVFYDYYEFLNTLIQSKPPESDLIGNNKEEFIQRLKDTYNNFLASYENLVTFETDEDENTSLDADTLVEYNKIALVLKYPNLTYELASEVQNRNDIYEAYKKVLEKKLKTYQADLDSLNKIATTLTSSTLRASDNSDEEAARMLNMNRRYKDLGNNSIDTNSEVQKLKEAIAAAGEIYQGNVDEVEGFKESFLQYYDLDEYTPENIVDVLSDEYNRSELNKVKRILDKYDDEEKDPFDTDEYEEKRDKLIAERDAKTAGYETQLANIQEKIAELNAQKDNLQKKIDELKRQIEEYKKNIDEYNANISEAKDALSKYTKDDENFAQEGEKLIDYLLRYPTVQGNVDILIEYVEWLNSIANTLSEQVSDIFNGVESSQDYADRLHKLIDTYEAELFKFLHKFNVIEEDLEDGFNLPELNTHITGMNQMMEDPNQNYNFTSYKNIFQLGLDLLEEETKNMIINDLETSTDKAIVTSDYNQMEQALRDELLPSQLPIEQFGVIYTYNPLTDSTNYYLAGIDKDQDVDTEYYPTPVWLDNINDIETEFTTVINSINAVKSFDEESKPTQINGIPSKFYGDWIRDISKGGTYRQCTEDTVFSKNTIYYSNTNGTVYPVANEIEFQAKIANDKLYYFISDSPIKTFSVTKYPMLYDDLTYIGNLQPKVTTYTIQTPMDPQPTPEEVEQSDIEYKSVEINGEDVYITEETIKIYSAPTELENSLANNNVAILCIRPTNYSTIFDGYLGEIVKSFGELKAYEEALRKSLLDMIYAYITYNTGLNTLFSNSEYIAYSKANSEYQKFLAETNRWQRTLTELTSVWNSGYSVENPQSEKGRQLELLLQEATYQYNYYSALATQAKEELEAKYGDLSVISDQINVNLISATNAYQAAQNNITAPYNDYRKKVVHYLTLLFNTNTTSNMVDKDVSHLTDEYADKYNLGLGPAIINYLIYRDAVDSNMDFSVLLSKIEEFNQLVNINYPLYEPVDCGNEFYNIAQYVYYEKINDKYYPYDSYSQLSWPTSENIYKVNIILNDFVGNTYELVNNNTDPNDIYYIYDDATQRYSKVINPSNLTGLYIYNNALENQGILGFLRMLKGSSDYMQNFKNTYLESLELYKNLLDRKSGSDDIRDELIKAKTNLELQINDLKELTDQANDLTIDEDEWIETIRRLLAKFLQTLSVAYVDEVERRYGVV